MADIRAGRLDAAVIAENFGDMLPAFSANEARVAAERCLFCHDAPCVTACPTSIDIPLFIRQIAAANPIGAARTILDSNIMGAMCARVCPTENLCEGVCVREVSEGKAIEIGRLQRHATDAAFTAGRQFYKAGPPTGRHVAVVGAGPAGLACAHKLATLGHTVTVFEARDKAGGLNEFGIAAYKATNDVAQHEVEYILAVGNITIEYRKRLGRNITLAGLKRDHDAVFLGMGLGDTNDLGLGVEPEGVLDAVTYITALRQAPDKAALPVGRRVVVIGGGMTAIDIATQTKKLGADEVTIVYRRGKDQMSASPYEQDVAQTHGVTIRHWMRPVEVVAIGGNLSAVKLEYTGLDGGKLVGTGETVTLPCDQLFKAIGQSFVTADLADAGGQIAMSDGRIAVDAERRTSLAGIWAGGDCVAGGQDLTVTAVEDGKRAALSIDRVLRGAAVAAAE
ncbi:MAG: NAD(P)-dependent oxidoreductase [Hyphomicrobiales bacterium]|nr:NAD(P)-dependent oxidoreductase [Hyphomicrobiales bacterium]